MRPVGNKRRVKTRVGAQIKWKTTRNTDISGAKIRERWETKHIRQSGRQPKKIKDEKKRGSGRGPFGEHREEKTRRGPFCHNKRTGRSWFKVEERKTQGGVVRGLARLVGPARGDGPGKKTNASGLLIRPKERSPKKLQVRHLPGEGF